MSRCVEFSKREVLQQFRNTVTFLENSQRDIASLDSKLNEFHS